MYVIMPIPEAGDNSFYPFQYVCLYFPHTFGFRSITDVPP